MGILQRVRKWWARSRERRSSSIENPNVPLSQVDLDSWVGVQGTTDAGIRVSHRSALKVAAFWQGVTMLSGDVAKIPLEIYQRGEIPTDRSVFKSHPAYKIVRNQPNSWQHAFDFRRTMMMHALIWNNAYAIVERDGSGNPVGLLPLLPDRTRSIRSADNQIVYETEVNGKLEYFDKYDIWHLKGISLDSHSGLDLVGFAKDGIGRILARENFASRFFKHGGRVGGILQVPFSNDKSKNQKREEGFRKLYERPDASFKTVVLSENAKFHQAQASFADTQMVEVGQQDVRHIARLLNMPAHKLGAEGNSSYNSLEQENQAYYDNCLSHWLTAIEAECWMKMFDRRTKNAGELYFEHKIGALLWADSKTVANIGSNGVRSGWLMPNEVRGWFNLNSVEGGDSLLVPSGMVAIGGGDSGESTRESLKKLISEVRARLRKRLIVHAKKQVTESRLKKWLDNGILEHLVVGRSMFEQIKAVYRTVHSENMPDFAKLEIDEFAETVSNSAEPLKFVKDL